VPVFAAIDIGSNSVRLKIAELVRRRLKVLHEDREVTRLGEAVFQSGLLDPAAMEHTVKVLRRFHRAAHTFGADRVRAVATSAIRDANNSGAFAQWVYSATGWRVEIISGLEEGRLIHLGVLANTRIRAERLLLIDLGGGSCELTSSHHGEIEEMFSLPLGAVRLTRDFLAHDPPKKNEIERLRSFIAEEIGRIDHRLRKLRVNATVATSGTPAALSAMWAARAGTTSTTVPVEGLLQLTRELSRLDVTARRMVKGIGPRRAEIIIPGAWVFSELLTRLNLSSFRYLPFGLRDGLLEQIAADYGEQAVGVRKRLASERERSIFAMAGHYQVDLRHAQRVRDHVTQLFHSLAALHHLPSECGELLQAAAMVQEVGSFISRAGRRRHAYYIVAHSDLLGFTLRERRIIAAIVRFVGKSRPSPESPAMRTLAPEDRLAVPQASMLLRLARALEQGRRGAVTGMHVSTRAGRVRLALKTKPGGAELELWALEKEKGYFRELFGRELDSVIA